MSAGLHFQSQGERVVGVAEGCLVTRCPVSISNSASGRGHRGGSGCHRHSSRNAGDGQRAREDQEKQTLSAEAVT